ncbi:MAG TPA: DUF397 domain-containing protein [Micromonosporaceae bacterium]|nr:DUF397 domain-containing protein [Micromonosporaceae bacterium]
MSTTPTSLDWRRSRRCEAGSCVEVALTGNDVAVRDSKNPDGPVLRFSMDEWAAFLGGVEEGDFRFN